MSISRKPAATAAFVNPDPVYLQSTEFVLDPIGHVVASVFSAGPSDNSYRTTSLDWFATWVNAWRNHGWSAQAVRHGDTSYVSGQFSHRGAQFHAPAPVRTNDAITDFSAMAEQMRQTYANAAEVLGRFEASLNNDALAPQPLPIRVGSHRGLVPLTLVNRNFVQAGTG